MARLAALTIAEDQAWALRLSASDLDALADLAEKPARRLRLARVDAYNVDDACAEDAFVARQVPLAFAIRDPGRDTVPEALGSPLGLSARAALNLCQPELFHGGARGGWRWTHPSRPSLPGRS